jgi:endonuclease/exonuclease/phosphatase family metal-dependent hydrolase
MQYMGGDFNCHLREWDDAVPHHRTTPILLVETAASLSLEYARPENPGHTYESRANVRVRSVIDLVFVMPDTTLSARVHRKVNLQEQSDHIPLSTTISLRQSLPDING